MKCSQKPVNIALQKYSIDMSIIVDVCSISEEIYLLIFILVFILYLIQYIIIFNP